MTTTASAIPCSFPYCTLPATHALPTFIDGEEEEMVCRECYDAYWDARRACKDLLY